MIYNNFKHSDLTGKILKSYFNVYNILGYGFLEKVYENALIIELKKTGLHCEKQKPIDVFYDDQNIGLYFADIIFENKVIIELKASEYLVVEHEAQLVNYLKATDIEVGLLLNFGTEAQYKRKVLSNEFKKHRQIIAK
ncbi:MAG: GxxExxY protein [Bacteroidetes bacterium]|nr:GxxExxY protein [Bacteroidota bacterium]